MRQYCKIISDQITGEIKHIITSSEPIEGNAGIITETDSSGNNIPLHHNDIIIGDPDDGNIFSRARFLLDRLEGNPAKQITFKPEVPQGERPVIEVGQAALDIITARKVETGRL